MNLDADASYKHAVALHEQWRQAEAVTYYRQALAIQPDHLKAAINLGAALHEQLKTTEAAAAYDHALRIDPHSADAHCNFAFLKLAQGDFEHGWQQYEWRWRLGKLRSRDFPQPLWDGEPLNGKTILLHAEQGLGDTLQFIRYAPLVKKRGGQVIVECQPQLERLLQGCPAIDRLVAGGNPIPAFDLRLPLLSLPRVFQTTLASIPTNIPYVFADQQLVQYWRQWLRTDDRLLIGVNWHGRSDNADYRLRNLPLDLVADLANLQSTRLISLQRGNARQELASSIHSSSIVDLGDEVDGTPGPFTDTAAIMKNLDLVITSDTVIAHLAGALGIPTWLALPHFPDWRWLLDRSDSPWYPTLRLFRQNQPGNWPTVFAEIRSALEKR